MYNLFLLFYINANIINLILVLLIVIGIVMLRRPEKFTQKTETQSSPFLKNKEDKHIPSGP